MVLVFCLLVLVFSWWFYFLVDGLVSKRFILVASGAIGPREIFGLVVVLVFSWWF